MAKCIYKEKMSNKEQERSGYKHKCTWGSHQSTPPAYQVTASIMDFVYLDPGECKGCECTKTAGKNVVIDF